MELVRLIKMCLNEICHRFRIRMYFNDGLLVKMVEAKELIYRHCFSNFIRM
jgi:hypothetical protein